MQKNLRVEDLTPSELELYQRMLGNGCPVETALCGIWNDRQRAKARAQGGVWRDDDNGTYNVLIVFGDAAFGKGGEPGGPQLTNDMLIEVLDVLA